MKRKTGRREGRMKAISSDPVVSEYHLLRRTTLSPRNPQSMLWRVSMPDKRMHNLLDLFLFLFYF